MPLLIFLAACVLFTTTVCATSIQNCSDGSVTVQMGTADVLTCVGYTATKISWAHKPTGAQFSTVGHCNSSSCTFSSPAFSTAFSLTALSGTSSQLGLTSTFTASLRTATFSCGGVECIVHIVAPAVSSTPNITVTTPPPIGSGWTVRGTVDIKGMSPSGTYTCMWSYMKDSGQYTNITSSITIDPPASATSNRTGQCAFPDRSLPSDPGTYTYRVTVSPGQTLEADSVVIETPAISSSDCNTIPNTGYVAENEELSCTCNGSMGQPAGRLRWFNENTTGTTAIEDGQYGDGTLTLKWTVNRYNDGDKLRCEVDWITDIKGPDFTLQVAYPPSSPVISRTDGQYYPPLEGDTVTLTCTLTSPGYPSARITWPSEEGPTVNTNLLQLSVDRGDNQRNVTCQASNNFTQRKGLELRDNFTLHVYYEPIITLRPAQDNRCIMTSDRTSCHVTEGQRVHLLCDVDSNPHPRECTWSGDLVAGPDLDIVSVNRTHSGVYQVQVETTKPDNSDDRLPLREHSSLTVLVKSSTVHREDESPLSVGAAVGITLAVVIVIVLIFITWVWRRGWILPCASDGRGQVGQETSSSRHRKEPNRERPPLESAGPAVSEDYELMEDGSRRHAGAEHQSPSPYASLQTSDIGVPSVYSQISQRSDTVFNVHHDPVYENSGGQEQT